MDSNGKKTQEISSRIDQIRQYFCNGVNVDFAAKIGKDPTYTSQLCTGTKSIGNKIIEKILETFPEVSKTWLYLGEGDMLTSDGTSEQTADPRRGNRDDEELEMLRKNNAAHLKHIELLEEKVSSLEEQLECEKKKVSSLSARMSEERILQ
jgi:hypothetical protein